MYQQTKNFRENPNGPTAGKGAGQTSKGSHVGGTTPTQPPPHLDPQERLLQSTLALTNCPVCYKLFVLSSDKQRLGASVECNLCGVLPKEHQKSVRQQQIRIVQATVTNSPPTPSDMTETDGVQHQMTEGTIQDESMGIPQNADAKQAQAGATNTGPTHDVTSTPKHALNEASIYEESDDDEQDGQGEETVEFDTPWLTAALDNLDDKWARRWTALQDQLSKDAVTNKSELKKIREAQVKGTAATVALAMLTNTRLDSVEANQRTIMKAQDEQKQALRATQEAVIADIEKQLKSTMKHFDTTEAHVMRPGNNNPNTYAQKAAQPPRNTTEPPNPYQRT